MPCTVICAKALRCPGADDSPGLGCMTPLSLGDAPILQSTGSWSQQLMMYGEARVPMQPSAPCDALADGMREPGRSLLRSGGHSAPSLLASGQGWERVCDDALPERPSHSDPAVPDAPAMQPPALPAVDQDWVRVSGRALPESLSHQDPAVPDAPGVQLPASPGVSPEELLAMYKHDARALQLEGGGLATLAAAAGNAAAVAVLSAVQNARHAAAVRLLAFISFPHGAAR